jgi:adenine-specific DNA-methyltransferase
MNAHFNVQDAPQTDLLPDFKRQVLPYVRFTQRYSIVQPFTPEESEDRLYNSVSIIPTGQPASPFLQVKEHHDPVLRKILASSSFAIRF